MITSEYTAIKVPAKEYSYTENKVVQLYKELNIRSIPINPWDIAKRKGYEVIPFSKAKNQVTALFYKCEVNGGASYWNATKQKYVIYYNDDKNLTFQKFTIMHEIGHIILGHKEDSELAERMANYFAAYSLAPSPLIAKYSCEDKTDLMNIFEVSDQCANICFGRYLNWQNYGGDLKDYEEELLHLVK